MIIDGIAAGLILLAAIWGFFSGLAKQLVRIAAIVAAYLLAVPSGHYAASYLGQHVSTSYALLRVGATLLLGLTYYIVLSVVGTQIFKRIDEKSETFSKIDRRLGALAGGLKGGLLAYLALTILVFALPSLRRSQPLLAKEAEASMLTRLASESNIAGRLKLPRFRAIYKIALLASNRTAMQKAAENPAFRRILENPKAKFLLEPKIIQAVLEKNYLLLIKDGRIFDLIDDPQFQRDLDRIDLDSV
ncbi:MAG: CvpA family protein [Myxococcales bacterium]|nr:CvpA family protein [Myxococcales bacterium]